MTTPPRKMTGGQALVRSIVANGVDTVFGLPGIQLDGFFNALHDAGNEIRVINARHEQGVAYMALGYAQSTGKVGTFAVVPGPGILNAGAALSTAYGCNVPVLGLTGQIPSAMIGRAQGLLHEIPDQLGVMERLTKWSARIDHPTDVPAKVKEAFRQLQGGRPRPVGLEMALDMLHLSTMVALEEPEGRPATPPLDPDQIEAAAKALGESKAPMIVVGGGGYEASGEIRELSRMLQAPVSSYQNGRGIMDERDPLGMNNNAGNKLWQTADVVISIGCRLQPERMTWGNKGLTVIHVDIDPTELTRVRAPTIGIVGDAAEATRAIIDAVGKYSGARPSRTEELLEVKARADADIRGAAAPQMAWIDALRAALPDDGLFVDEFTQVGYLSRVGFPVYHPRTLINPGYQGTLGYGYATALGVKVAHPDKPVLSINGDGGFMYTMPEIATAVHHGINLVAVVFADGAYGNVMRMQEELYDGRVIGSRFTNPDFVKLAESFGAVGMRAETPDALAGCLKTAFDTPSPTIIEVPVGKFPEAFHVVRPTISRDTAAG